MKKLGGGQKANISRCGFMPDFEQDIFDEIIFAKQNFSFIELTLKKDLKNYSKKCLGDIKQALKGFRVFGHLHWDIDLRDSRLTLAHLAVYHFLGIEQITIHPQMDVNLMPFVDFCRKNKIILLIENSINPPLNSVDAFLSLFNEYPFLKMTFDLGHSFFIGSDSYEKFFQTFTKSIKHIHLHYNYKRKIDHLPFRNSILLVKVLAGLKKYGIKPTITLEIFEQLVGENKKALSGQERHKVLIQQATMVNNSRNLLSAQKPKK